MELCDTIIDHLLARFGRDPLRAEAAYPGDRDLRQHGHVATLMTAEI